MIQPFDGGRFDKLFEDVFDPAVRDAGLRPYRVDRDPGVSIPIEEIEEGIRNSAVCFAELSIDNPNVWFELGYAIALGKQLILVCAKGRPKYPFDIQHRSIISYESESPRDFVKLKADITARADALLRKELNQQSIRITTVTAPSAGLSSHELTCLATIAAQSEGLEGTVAHSRLKSEMERAGFNSLATTLGLKSLIKQNMIEMRIESDWNGNETYETYLLTDTGWTWTEKNLHLLSLRLSPEQPAKHVDDDIPF